MGKSKKKDALIFILLFFVTTIIVIYAMFLFYESFSEGEEIKIDYTENLELNYKVWLKENEFYSEEYLGEEYNIVASVINEIELDFKYLLTMLDYVKGKSYYKINSRIIAYQKNDMDEKKVWDYQKIIKDKIITLYDQDTTKILSEDNIKINYDEYRVLMDNYQKQYAVSLVGNLIIEIEIKTDLNYDKFEAPIDLKKREMSVIIPLTEPIIKITKNVPELGTKQLIEKKDSTINYLKLGLSTISFVGGLVMCVFLGTILAKLFGFDSEYVRKLNKLLRTYNSIIVNVQEIKIPKGCNMIEVSSFDELLDAQSELRVPILYSNIRNNKEDLFVIKYDKDMLSFKMKSDLYAKNKNKGKNEK